MVSWELKIKAFTGNFIIWFSNYFIQLNKKIDLKLDIIRKSKNFVI